MDSSSMTSIYMKELQQICSKMADRGTESLFLTVNLVDKSCSFIGSSPGGQFLTETTELLKRFYTLCQDCSLPNGGMDSNKQDKMADGIEKDVEENHVTLKSFHYDEIFSDDLSNEIDTSVVIKGIDDLSDKGSVTMNMSTGEITDTAQITKKHCKAESDFESESSNQDDFDNNSDIGSHDDVETNKGIIVSRPKRFSRTKTPTWMSSYVLTNEKKSKQNEKDKKESVTLSHVDHDYIPSGLNKSGNNKLQKQSQRIKISKRKQNITESVKITFCCPICDKMFSQSRYLSIHMVSVHLDKCSICKVCGKMFDSKQNLMNHKVKHEEPCAGDGNAHGVEEGEIYAKRTMDTRKKPDGNRSEKGINFVEEGENVVTQITATDVNTKKMSKCGIDIEADKIGEEFCKYCKEDFPTKDDYKNHLALCVQIDIDTNALSKKVHHKKPPSDPLNENHGEISGGNSKINQTYSCNQCSRVFSSQIGLGVHRKKHENRTNGDNVKNLQNKKVESPKSLSQDCEAHANKNRKFTKKNRCDICHRNFSTKTGLVAHKRVHETKTMHNCDACEKEFRTKALLKFHKRAVHQVNKTPKCRFCKQPFTSYKEVRRHYRTSHASEVVWYVPKKKYRCNICRKACLSEEHLQKHIEARHVLGTNTTYQCHHCQKIFREPTYLTTHLECVHKEKRSVCRICKALFPSVTELRSHLLTHKTGNETKCNFCGQVFDTTNDLMQHQANHFEKSTAICEICGKTFRRNFELIIHRRHHSGERPFHCKICDSSFVARNYLNRHMIVVHQEHHQQFQCEICGHSYKSEQALAFHSKYHSSDFKTIKCDFCESEFLTGEGIRSHIVTSHADSIDLSAFKFKIRKCEHCGKIFTQNQAYVRHVRTHTGERPVTCDVCGKGFANVASLNRHKYIHNTFKRFMCDICGSGVNTNSKLKKHFRSNKHIRHCEQYGISVEESKSRIKVTDPPKYVRVIDNCKTTKQDLQTDNFLQIQTNETTDSGMMEDDGQKQISTDGMGDNVEFKFENEESLVDLSNVNTETTECVIISIPENVHITTLNENEIMYDITANTAVPSILNTNS